MLNHLYAVIFKSHAYLKNNIKNLSAFKSVFFKEMQLFLRCGDVEEGIVFVSRFCDALNLIFL